MVQRLFRFGHIFKAGDDDAAFALQLLCACNDLRSAVRIGLNADRLEAEKVRVPRSVDGDRLYALRMGTMHLADLLRFAPSGFEKFFTNRFGDSAGALRERARALIQRVNRGGLQGLTNPPRNTIVAHYDLKVIKEAMARPRVHNESVMWATDEDGAERHVDATDVVFAEVLRDATEKVFPAENFSDSVAAALSELAEVQIAFDQLAISVFAILVTENVLRA